MFILETEPFIALYIAWMLTGIYASYQKMLNTKAVRIAAWATIISLVTTILFEIVLKNILPESLQTDYTLYVYIVHFLVIHFFMSKRSKTYTTVKAFFCVSITVLPVPFLVLMSLFALLILLGAR